MTRFMTFLQPLTKLSTIEKQNYAIIGDKKY